MRWAALDFETATRERTSACQLGLVIVEDGEIVEQKAWLIQPPQNEYDWRCIRVHGIKPHRTVDAPPFAEIWGEAAQLIGDRPLVAHNASFDMGVIKASLEAFDLQTPGFDYACTVSYARKAFPGLPAYKLPIVAAHVGAAHELTHHDALSDAVACARIMQGCFAVRPEAESVQELGEQLRVAPKSVPMRLVLPEPQARTLPGLALPHSAFPGL